MIEQSSYKRFYLIALAFSTIVVSAAFLGYALYLAREGNQSQRECFEKIILVKMPSLVTYYMRPDEKTQIREIEALSYLTIREHKPPGWFQKPEYCVDSYGKRAWQEVLGFEPRRVIEPGKPNPLVRRVVRQSYTGQFAQFDQWKYRCASTFATTYDPWRIYNASIGKNYQAVGEPIGRLQLYGDKEECTKK